MGQERKGRQGEETFYKKGRIRLWGGGGAESGALRSNCVRFGVGRELLVGASGYLAPFRQIFCLDWFLLWASERLICQMHKAEHICPVSSTHEVNASLFLSRFFLSSLLPFPPNFVLFHLFS